ncbi:MAG: undecaprenyl-diphosphate phosphatase [Synergistaceae bacterium]|nr:undecaprenyl-diphosphate phosphatase [Synergistaceae bacterium]
MDFEIIILGLIQGLTEFLPVSSSGHLALVQIFLGIEMPPLSYDLVLHVATACATILFFIGDIYALLCEWIKGFVRSDYRRSSGWPTGWAVVVGTVITGIIGISIKDFAESAAQNSLMVGLGLVFTGLILIFSRFIRVGLGQVRITDGIFVGIAQGIAVLPGVSRSGMTIVSGLSTGLGKDEAFRFSFLLSIPAILGATLIQAMQSGGWDNFVKALPHGWYLGALAAFFSGMAALVILKRLIITSRWWMFGIYCLVLGVSDIIVTYLGVW